MNNGLRLWLDDERPAPEGWIWCKNFVDLWVYLVDDWEQIKEISFDHDLGTDDDPAPARRNGTTITKWILEQLHFAGSSWQKHRWKWSVHSSNPVGRANMIANLKAMDKIWDQTEEEAKAQIE